MCFDPKRLDPQTAEIARNLLDKFRRPNREIVLGIKCADRLEQAIEDALHAMRGVPK
jgi:hypothetical protein